MSTPLLGVTYHRIHPFVDWRAFGRASLSGVIDRTRLILGEYLVEQQFAGVLSADSDLEPVDTSVTYGSSYNGQIIENKLFRGWLNITGEDILFRNCKAIGPASYVDSVIVRATDNRARGIVFEDCTIKPRYGEYRQHAVSAHGTTFTRCDISGGVDGIGVVPYSSGSSLAGRVNVVIEGSWIHDLAFWSPDPTHSDDQTHNDLIQWHGGKGLRVVGNRFDAYLDPTIGQINDPHSPSTAHLQGDHVSGPHYPVSDQSGKPRAMSVLMVSPGNGTHGELVFEDNWMNGSYVGINAKGSPLSTFADGLSSVKNNHAGLDWRHTEERGAFSVANSFAYYMTAEQRTNLGVTPTYLWDPADPLQTAVLNNTVQTGSVPAAPMYP